MSKEVTLYALSTCGWCRKAKTFFTERGIPFRCIDVDLLEGAEREQAMSEVARLNPRRSFPTIRIGERTVVGFNVAELEQCLSDE